MQSTKSVAMLLAVFVWLITATGARLVWAQDTGSQGSDQNQAAPPPSEQSAPDQGASAEAPYAKLSKAQLERLVAPIALYPDALVAQILSASTFPSEIADAEGWLQIHPGLSGADLAKQADQQDWDPSVKALVQYPSVLANLSKNLGWTSELGDAYYNQQEDVMKAVQEMRKKAKKAGNLKPTPQLNVDDDDGQIDITPVDPDVVYVPAYDPWEVYGYPIAPWPYWVDVPGIWWDGPGMYFGLGFRSPHFSDTVGDGVRGVSIGITTESSSIMPRTMREGRHFSIAALTMAAVLASRVPADMGDGWVAGAPIVDTRPRVPAPESGPGRLAASTMAGCPEAFQPAVRAVSAVSMAADSVEAASTAALADAGSQLSQGGRHIPTRKRVQACHVAQPEI